jgi:putative N-acetylmannosamine-6-phosphate epimerase
VEADARAFVNLGCAGVDLLAYRATEAEPIDLVKAARRGLGREGMLICAGAVDSPARIAALRDAGCDAFTIGSAAFDGSFSPRKGGLRSQLADILACV